MPPKKGAKKKAVPKEKENATSSKRSALRVMDVIQDTPSIDMDVESEKKVSSSKMSIPVERRENEDKLSFYSRKYWSKCCRNSEFDDLIVKEVFSDELGEIPSASRLIILEGTSYLENYLWSNLSPVSSFEHLFSIVYMIIEKCRNRTSGFNSVTKDIEKFHNFFNRVVALSPPMTSTLSWYQQATLVKFFGYAYQCLDNEVVRQCTLRYLSLPIWRFLTPQRLRMELDSYPALMRHWEHVSRDFEGLGICNTSENLGNPPQAKRSRNCRATVESPKKKVKLDHSESSVEFSGFDSTWVPSLLKYFLKVIDKTKCDVSFESQGDVNSEIYFVERFCEFVIDLLSQLPTRRFLNTLLDDMNFVLRCKKSVLYSALGRRHLFQQLVDRLDSYSRFEIQDQSGQAMTAQDVMASNNARLHKAQHVAHGNFAESMQDLYFSSTGALGKEEKLRSCLSLLTPKELVSFANKLGYIDSSLEVPSSCDTESEFVMDILLDKLAYRHGQLDKFHRMSLIPTENLLWNPNLIPHDSQYSGDEVLCLPKLNLQFLTIHDYLLRNFSLFRLESAYEIRQDLQDAIKRMSPRQSLNRLVTFGGWARMALPIHSLNIDEVQKPSLGDVVPARVSCSIEIDLSRFQGVIRDEWEALREHDVVFFISIRNPHASAGAAVMNTAEGSSKKLGRRPAQDFAGMEDDIEFAKRFGVEYVRGGEIFEVRDEEDCVLNDPTRPDERATGRVGAKRRLRCNLDSAQYYSDMTESNNCYEKLNLLVRRKPKENNFKAILETICGLMNTENTGKAVPGWLHDVFLGYGKPEAAHFRNLSDQKISDDGKILEKSDYTDTFLDANHIVESFPDADVTFQVSPQDDTILLNSEISKLSPPFNLEIRRAPPGVHSPDKVIAVPYIRRNEGPFPQDNPPSNSMRYTPAQVKAVRSGMNKGLTMIVGPPGTGKTDVAVQIICNLYHNHPTQKILVVAHSNTALNDLFEKIMQRNVDPRHLLRLGSGEKDLFGGHRENEASEGEDIFSKQGRVNWSLTRRMQLLKQVQYLATTLNIDGDVGFTCETAKYFFLEHIQSRLEKFSLEIIERSDVKNIFPFASYFESAPQPLFRGESFDDDVEVAKGCFRHIEKLFEELSDYRAFELLRTQGHRADYLLTKQARIVAMTCTHAAMTRKKLVQLGFKYDTLVMEEAAQVLEVETLIPMLLQDVDTVDGCRLKRVVLLGDHHQLPPVVQHRAFQRFSHLDQSLFSRFIRLSVPHVQLDRQGRCRPEIAALFNWRYFGLGDLPIVSSGIDYVHANAGFVHSYQLIDVPAFEGKGEQCPVPHFYQNVGEAEYVVAVYQFMRLIGYPAEKISILTTYNGQKQLIRDIISQRCKNPIFGSPHRVTTVDKYQGQQNDFVLLSFVRTESIGHLRDIRRLVVAASRARLGLYVFCRQALFENCLDLRPTFDILLKNSSALQLVDGEKYPCQRKIGDVVSSPVIDIRDVTAMGVVVYQMTQHALHGNVLPCHDGTESKNDGEVNAGLMEVDELPVSS